MLLLRSLPLFVLVERVSCWKAVGPMFAFCIVASPLVYSFLHVHVHVCMYVCSSVNLLGIMFS